MLFLLNLKEVISIIRKCKFHISKKICRADNGLFSAMRLQEFVLTKPVCELIDFDFDPVLIKLSSIDYPDICKLVLQGIDLNFSCH